MWKMVLYVVFSYLVGAIPTAFIIAKQLKGIDIREHGSGNVGATNVKRVVGPKAGLATLILDFIKGVIPVMLAPHLFPPSTDPYQLTQVFAGLAVIIGHSKSIYIGFKGGKSAITSLGVIFGLSPLAALIVGIVAFGTIKITRYVSVGSMLGAIMAPISLWLVHAPVSNVVLTFLMGVYVIFLHRSNIQRLIKHQENRI